MINTDAYIYKNTPAPVPKAYLELIGSILEQIDLAKGVLCVTRVELDHIPDALIGDFVNRQGLGADVP
jgi:hypothetical protein